MPGTAITTISIGVVISEFTPDDGTTYAVVTNSQEVAELQELVIRLMETGASFRCLTLMEDEVKWGLMPWQAEQWRAVLGCDLAGRIM